MREKFREWLENSETFFREVVFVKHRQDFWARFVRGILHLLSKVYLAVGGKSGR